MSPVSVVAPAKVNLSLVGGRAAAGRLPRPGHRLSRGLAVRRDRRDRRGTGLQVTVEAGPASTSTPCRSTRRTSRRGPRCCSPSRPGSDPDVHAAHPQGHPGRRRHGRRQRRRGRAPWSPATRCGAPASAAIRAARRSPPSSGSDVPFSLMGGTALGVGRGEQLTPALARGRFDWVFAVADGGLSTPQVYAECDRLRDGAGAARAAGVRRDDDARCGPATPSRSGQALQNDLQPAALLAAPAAAADAGGRRRRRRARVARLRQRADGRVPRPRRGARPRHRRGARRQRHLQDGEARARCRSRAPASPGTR